MGQEANEYVNLCMVHTKRVASSALRRRTLAVANQIIKWPLQCGGDT